MDHKELGQTGVRIPEIGFGTWRKTSVVPLRRGVELGAALIDTAESYGSESVVGKAVQGIRERIFIASKVSPSHFRREDILKAADRSLRRLRADYIDLYQLHWPNPKVLIEETMDGMEQLVREGKVRFIEVSNFSVVQLQEAQGAMSKYRIASNQVPYNLVDRSIEGDLLPYCRLNRITVIAYSPLATSLHKIKAGDRGGVLSKLAAMTGRTEAQVALNWCISKEGVVAIPRSNSIDHIEENCLASGWRLSAEHINRLEEAFQ